MEFDMLWAVLLVLFGIGLLVAGGESLLRGAVGLATLLRLTPAVIGLTVVAAGTSVPELAVSGLAAINGNNDIAVANVVGSNIFNIALIVGLCAAIRPFPITGNTLGLEYPFLLFTTLFCVLFAQGPQLTRLQGFLFLSAYIAFTTYLVYLAKRQVSREEANVLKQEVESIEPNKHPSTTVAMTLVVVGIILLGLGAQATVAGASQLARLWGWSERLIGLTIVSAGTSLPEVVASLVSSVRGRSDVALGNVIGSNIFNILAILGLSSLIQPLSIDAAIRTDCLWMLGITVLLLPILLNGKRIYRWEGVGLLTTYAIYMVVLLRN